MSALMKRMKWALLLMVLHSSVLSAQMVQYGRVVEMNSGGKALSGVSITIPSAHDCQPTSSDNQGVFRLNFGEHKVGDVIVGLSAKKYGYEIVNHHVVREGYTLTDKDSLRVVMAPVGTIAESRSQYYALLEAHSINRYDSTLLFLNQQYAQQVITKPELDYWKSKVESELKQAYQRMDDLADKLARVNKDDLKEGELPLYEKLVSGDVVDALALVCDEPETDVMEDYLAFSGNYPMTNPEIHVAQGQFDLVNIPDSLYADVMVLDNYTHQYESGFAANGPRYAKSCYYLGVILMDAHDRVMAENFFRKALRMYELLDEMEMGSFGNQISEIKELLKSFE